MAAVTVTAKVGATCHYWFTPKASLSLSGQGLNVLDLVHGWSFESADQTPVTLTWTLDDSTTWNVYLSFQGAPPVLFENLNVSGGGDLFGLLSAQGWTSL
jgi:hypothetical protein